MGIFKLNSSDNLDFENGKSYISYNSPESEEFPIPRIKVFQFMYLHDHENFYVFNNRIPNLNVNLFVHIKSQNIIFASNIQI